MPSKLLLLSLVCLTFLYLSCAPIERPGACSESGGASGNGPLNPTADALHYLATEQDVFHTKTVVYDGLETGGELFVPSGFLHGIGNQALKAKWTEEQLSHFVVTHVTDNVKCGPTALKIHWEPQSDDEWVGLAFQAVEGNWTAKGIDLTGATEITFYARASGNEHCTFEFGSADDSTWIRLKGMRLSDGWRFFRIPLSGRNLTNIRNALTVSLASSRHPVEIFLSDIVIDKPRLNEPRFIRSFRVGNEPLPSKLWFMRNIAHVYDQSICVAAFLSANTPAYLRRAELICDAFVAVVEDGGNGTLRIRNAYSCGALKGQYRANNWRNEPRLSGFMPRSDTGELLRLDEKVKWQLDEYGQGYGAGNNAFVCLALLDCADAIANADPVRAKTYRETARRLAAWVSMNCRNGAAALLNKGFSGGGAHDGKQDRDYQLLWVSTEHNIDLACAFHRLAAIETDPAKESQWQANEKRALDFVDWAKIPERLVTGTAQGNAERALSPAPLDIQPWSVLAFPAHQYAFGMNWARLHCAVTLSGRLTGYSFSTSSLANIWPEGTCHMCLAERSLGCDKAADALLKSLESIQKLHADAHPDERGALPGAYPNRVDTGYTDPDIFYMPFAHIAATAWYVCAKDNFNVYFGTRLSPRNQP